MKLERFTYLLAFLLLVVFASDLEGQFRRKKVKLSQNNQIEEFINDEIEKIQDEIVKSFDYKMIRHIHQLFVLCNKCQ